MCFVVGCDYGCYVITITYLLSAVTYFLEYHLTEITEKTDKQKIPNVYARSVLNIA